MDLTIIAAIGIGGTALFGLGFAMTVVELADARLERDDVHARCADLHAANKMLEADCDRVTEALMAQERVIRDQGRTIAEYRAKEPARGAGGKFARKAA